MTVKRYMIVRGELLADPSFTIASHGGELTTLDLGVRMPDGLVEPVSVEAGDLMPAYCRAQRLEQNDMVVVSGWARSPGDGTEHSIILQADMIAAHTSLDWKEPS